MTRLFREGRTETVRSCTVESSAFAKAVCEGDKSDEELKKLLLKACEVHQTGYRDAMTGKGRCGLFQHIKNYLVSWIATSMEQQS